MSEPEARGPEDYERTWRSAPPASPHHRFHVVRRDLAGRRLPDIAEALDAAQRFVEIFYAMRRAHQPRMDGEVEHLAALLMQQLEGLADQIRIARRGNAPQQELLHVVPFRLVGHGDERLADLHRIRLIVVRPVEDVVEAG